MEENIKKMLEEQLQLLSERSKNAPLERLAEITAQMVNVSNAITYESQSRCFYEVEPLPFEENPALQYLAGRAVVSLETVNRRRAALQEELNRLGKVAKPSPKSQ